jgi:hypothetical protein
MTRRKKMDDKEVGQVFNLPGVGRLQTCPTRARGAAVGSLLDEP